MAKKPYARGAACAGRRGSGCAARNDADEAMEDTQAELNDISAALNTPEAAAGESAGGLERPSLPEPLLHRRLDKERPEKEKAFGITDGGPIIGTYHPVITEMFAIPITCVFCCSLNFRGLLVLNPLIAALGWQVISNQRSV
jgi:hypothetical protein